MLGAMARAYAVLGDEKYRAAAEKNLAFIQEKLWQRRTGVAPVSNFSNQNQRQARRLSYTTAGATVNATTSNCSKAMRSCFRA